MTLSGYSNFENKQKFGFYHYFINFYSGMKLLDMYGPYLAKLAKDILTIFQSNLKAFFCLGQSVGKSEKRKGSVFIFSGFKPNICNLIV